MGVKRFETHGNSTRGVLRFVTAHDLNSHGWLHRYCECEQCRAIESPMLTAEQIARTA